MPPTPTWWASTSPTTPTPPGPVAAFQQATNLYVALGLEETVAYYNTKESVDGQWYVFDDENQTIIALCQSRPSDRGGASTPGW